MKRNVLCNDEKTSLTLNRILVVLLIIISFLSISISTLILTEQSAFADSNSKITKKIAKAEKYFKKGKIDKALSLLEELVKKYQDDPRPAITLSKYYLDNKLYNDAIGYAEKAYSIDKNSKEAINILCNCNQGIGQMDIQKKRFDQAKAAYDKMYELCPTEENKKRIIFLYSKKAGSDIDQERFPEAFQDYQKMLQLEPENRLLYFEMFKLAMKNKDEDKAIDILQKGVNRFPDDQKLVKILGGMFFKNKKYDEAKSLFNRILEKEPSNLFIATYLAYSEQSIANTKFKALKDEGKLPEVTKTPGKTKASIKAYKKEVQEKKDELIALKQEIYQPTVDAFNRAIQLDKEYTNPRLMMTLALLYGFINKPDDMSKMYLQAMEVFNQKSQKNPDDVDSLFFGGFCALNAGGHDAEAEKLFREVISKDTDKKHVNVPIYLAEILVDQKKFGEAREMLEQFKKDYPDNPAIKRADQWINYISAGTPEGKKPHKLDISEPVIKVDSNEQKGLTLDDDTSLSE